MATVCVDRIAARAQVQADSSRSALSLHSSMESCSVPAMLELT